MKHLAKQVGNNRTPIMEALEENDDYRRDKMIALDGMH